MGTFIDVTLLCGLFLVGWFLLVFALHPVRRKAEAQCLKCGHDMCIDPGLTCRECGYTHASEWERMHGKVNRRALKVVAGLMLVQMVVWVCWGAQALRNRDAAKAARRVSVEVSSVIRADSSWFPVNTAKYTAPTLWVARMMGKPTETKALDGMDPGWTDLRGGMTYLSCCLMSPMRHFGRFTAFDAPHSYAVSRQGQDIPADVLETALTKIAPCSGIDTLYLLERCTVNDASAAQIGKMDKLQYLQIMKADITEKGMAGFSGLHELENLILVTNQSVTDDFLRPLAGAKLKSIHISGNDLGRVTPVGAEALRGQGLNNLSLRAPYWVGDHPKPFDWLANELSTLELTLPDVDGPRLAQLTAVAPNLKLQLDLSGNSGLDDEDLDALGRIPFGPESLGIKGNGRMTGAGIARLLSKASGSAAISAAGSKRKPAYAYIELSRFTLDEAFFDSVGASDVVLLALENCRVQPSMWEHMSENKNLAYISIRDMALGREDFVSLGRVRMLTSLTLEGIKLTNEQLREIAQMPRLKWLGIDEVDDEMLMELKECTWLEITAVKDATTPGGRAAAGSAVKVIITGRPRSKWMGS